MSIKRVCLSFVSGFGVQIALVWGISRLFHWDLNRINWRSVFVWAFFGAGFLSACLFHLWFLLINRLFRSAPKTTGIGQRAGTSSLSDVSSVNISSMSPSSESVTISATPKQAVPNSAPIVSDSVVVPTASADRAAPPPTASAASPSSAVQASAEQTVRVTSLPPRPMPMKVTPPARMAVQSGAVLNINPTQPMATPTAASGPTPTTPVTAAPQASSVGSSFSPVQSNTKTDINTLYDLDTELDMQAFKYVVLDNTKANERIDLVYSSDDVAVLCKVLSEPHTWTIDMTPSIEECVWTDEQGGQIRPCALLLKQAEGLHKMEPVAEIIACFVVMRGRIQNYQQVADYLLQNKITLLQYENENMPDLTSLHRLLVRKFSLYPGYLEDENSVNDTDAKTSETDSQETEDATP